MTSRNIADLIVGDILYYYGGKFKVTSSPYEVQNHRPLSGGPANCAKVDTVCIGSEIQDDFKVGSLWDFQGTVAGEGSVYHWIK